MCGVGVKRVCCGSHFTVFLTFDGRVLTCGAEYHIGQPETRTRCHAKPQEVIRKTYFYLLCFEFKCNVTF